MAETRTPSMLQVFNEHFNRAAHYVKAPADLLEYIRSCHGMYSLNFPSVSAAKSIFHTIVLSIASRYPPREYSLTPDVNLTTWRWQP